VGAAVGSVLTGILLEWTTWRVVFGFYAFPGLLWVAWFFWWFRDRPSDHPSVNAAELALLPTTSTTSGDRPEATPWLKLATSSALFWICGQQFFRAAAYIFYMSWFATFLQEAHGVSRQQSGLLTSIPFWTMMVGSLAGGFTSDWVLTRSGSRRLGRQGVAFVSSLLAALLILVARFQDDVNVIVALIGLSAFCAAMAGPCAYAITIDMGGQHIATVFSIMNMAGNVGAMIFPVVVPYLVGTDKNWDLVLLVFTGINVLSAFCWLFLNPHGTVFDRSAN
jgi:ACS family glucarate transporter-like MFS transporter